MSDITIEPISKPFTASITPPGSKSLSNRALVLGALSDGKCQLDNLLLADDTAVMIESLRTLGFSVESSAIVGQHGKIPANDASLDCRNSGTTLRFLTALCALGSGEFDLDGSPRMRQRPIAPLLEMLKNLGVRCEYAGEAGFPPIRVVAHGLPGGIVRVPSLPASSQFLSALLMVAPYARKEIIVDLELNQTSWPYVAMTMRIMDAFGITPELVRDPKTSQPMRIVVPQGVYRATNYAIEPDATAAGYFLALAAIHPQSKVTIEGLGKSSVQGDVAFADALHRMGAALVFGKDFISIAAPVAPLEGIDVDLSTMPDCAQTLAVVALFARGQTIIRGLHTLRHKETDRLAAMQSELSKLGAHVEIEDESSLKIDPPETIRPASIATYDDHRMAMSFALAGTKVAGVTIENAECVAKTYPNFFDDLNRVTKDSR